MSCVVVVVAAARTITLVCLFVFVIFENYFLKLICMFAAFIFMIDMKSTSSNNNNNNKPEAIYGQSSLVDDGAQAAASSNYGRVSVAQEAAVYGETSLRTE